MAGASSTNRFCRGMSPAPGARLGYADPAVLHTAKAEILELKEALNAVF
jgi:hypothetical protein